MTDFSTLINFENPVFKAYGFYTAVLVVKLLLMGPLTGIQRHRKKVFANPEDAKTRPGAKVKFDDPDVERVRRAHLNDLESLVPFFVVGFLYVLIDPPVFLAVNIFRIVACARIIHTFVYAIMPMPQPARGIAFMGGMIPTLFMAVCISIALLF